MKNFIENAAKTAALKSFFEESALSVYCIKKDDLYAFVMTSLSNGTKFYREMEGQVKRSFEKGDSPEIGLYNALNAAKNEFIAFFDATVANLYKDVPKAGLSMGLNNVQEHTTNETDYFRNGDGSDAPNNEAIAKTIETTGFLLEVVENSLNKNN
jgi:hypothetical protein